MTATSCAALLLGGGCADGVDLGAEPDIGHEGAQIINGTPDTTHQAVVTVAGGNSLCSGTIIHRDGNIGHVITAAHCATPQYVLQGNDYNNPDYTYPVIDYKKHPSYNQQVYDFMVVRFTSAGPATPVIPAMTAAQDNLTAGTQVRHVGYGKAGPAPGSDNSIRRQILGNLSGVQALTLSYNQPNGGPCSGDSGGPQLTTSGPELVAGVVSYGDQNCVQAGVSGRISAIYDNFIMAYINGTPVGPQTCDQCQQAATSGQGDCMSAVDACLNNTECNALVECYNGCSTNSCYQTCANQHAAGVSLYNQIVDCICTVGCPTECGSQLFCQGGSSSSSGSSSGSSGTGGNPAGGGGPTGGAGGAGAQSSSGTEPGPGDWLAGAAENQKYDGEILMSSCAARAAREGRAGDPWLLGLALAALGVGARRRSAAGK